MSDDAAQVRAGSDSEKLAAANATIEFILDAIKGDRFKDQLGHTAASYVRYSLGTAGFVYHVRGFCDVEAERVRAREALRDVRDELSNGVTANFDFIDKRLREGLGES